MPVFNSMSDMLKYVQNEIAIVSKNELGERIKKELAAFVFKKVYFYPAYEYDRTFDLINSITIGDVKEEDGGISCSVYFDSDKIIPTQSDNKWQQHRSVFNYDEDIKYSESISDMIPYYLEYGTQSPIYSHPAHGFMEATIRSLNKGLFKREIKKILKSRGYEVL